MSRNRPIGLRLIRCRSAPTDEAERTADRAAATIWHVRKVHVGPGDAIGVHRQFIGATPVTAPTQSQAELIVESFLKQMWAAQSKQEQPFRITPGVLEGLQLSFPWVCPICATPFIHQHPMW